MDFINEHLGGGELEGLGEVDNSSCPVLYYGIMKVYYKYGIFPDGDGGRLPRPQKTGVPLTLTPLF